MDFLHAGGGGWNFMRGRSMGAGSECRRNSASRDAARPKAGGPYAAPGGQQSDRASSLPFFTDITDDAGKVVHSFTVGRHTIKLTRLDARPGSISLALSMTDGSGMAAGMGRMIGGRPDENQTVDCRLLDSTRTELHDVHLSGGGETGAIIGTNFTPPLKLRLSVPIRTKDVKIPFELKNLPLP